MVARCNFEDYRRLDPPRLLTLFSGVLEFNNLFASYKGEGTGAVRHMFSRHILKPERTPIEGKPLGNPQEFRGFLQSLSQPLVASHRIPQSADRDQRQKRRRPRLLAAFHREGRRTMAPARRIGRPRNIPLLCRQRATGLSAKSVDLVVTDPPFFDNVHYSELADFFFAWQRLHSADAIGELADDTPRLRSTGCRCGPICRQTAGRVPRVPPHSER